MIDVFPSVCTEVGDEGRTLAGEKVLPTRADCLNYSLDAPD